MDVAFAVRTALAAVVGTALLVVGTLALPEPPDGCRPAAGGTAATC